VRTLVVAADYPWPVNSGSRLRLSATVEGLAAAGPTDLFAIVSDRRRDLDPPPDTLGPSRVEHIGVDDRPSPAGWARALARRDMPFELPVHRRARVSAALAKFASGATDPYDLVWCFRVRAWVLAGEPALAPVVVDLDDLEDQKIAARLALARGGDAPVLARWRARAGRALWRADMARWRRLHERIGRRSVATVVCSALDAGRAGMAGTRVVPNGYEPPAHPAGRPGVGSPPTVLFHGTLRYPPNADAARYLVDEVVPALRALVPDVAVRLVGHPAAGAEALGDPPRVTLVGQVPDITTELGGADVVVVPLRFASGTRVKILEAFAHRIPVVSTSIGAEGLDVDDGVHLLLADSAGELARACARLLTDTALRARLVEQAHDLFLARYQASSVRRAVRELAEEAAAYRSPSPS
jgi:glycosyltransferase involved in cell wall biosynthesis